MCSILKKALTPAKTKGESLFLHRNLKTLSDARRFIDRFSILYNFFSGHSCSLTNS
jgi:hypothetical protein